MQSLGILCGISAIGSGSACTGDLARELSAALVETFAELFEVTELFVNVEEAQADQVE